MESTKLHKRKQSKEYMAEYRDLNRDRLNSMTREWKKNNKDRVRSAKMKERYGISLDDYNSILESQGRRCAICRSEDPGRKNTKMFAIDHCHETGKIRGLLCYKCNAGLGMLGDTLESVKLAIKYLEVNHV